MATKVTKQNGIVNANGQRLYRCEVERQYTGTFFIWSDSKAEAQDDAGELMGDFLSDLGALPEDDVYVMEAHAEPQSGDAVWSGGPDGYWDDWEAK